MAMSATPTAVLWNMPCPTTPRRKAGPALLQKKRVSSASCRVRLPWRWRRHTAWAPTGYPPTAPRSSAGAAAPGRWKRGRIHRPAARLMVPAMPRLTQSSVRTKKGKRLGSSVPAQRLRASLAAAAAAPGRRSRERAQRNSPTAPSLVVRDFMCIRLTSKEIYAHRDKSLPLPHKNPP